jgi:hypothetical protein
MASTGLSLPADSAALDAAWITAAMRAGGCLKEGAVSAVECTDLGAGVGLTSEVVRLHLDYAPGTEAGPASVIAKLPTKAPENLMVARQMFLYAREVGFYRHLAANSPIRTPSVYYADIDEPSQNFVLLLEDLGALGICDQLNGATEAQAFVAIEDIAHFHAAWWNKVDAPPLTEFADAADPQYANLIQMGYMAYLQPCLDKFGDHLPAPIQDIMQHYAPTIASTLMAESKNYRSFLHGDYRADNMFFDMTADKPKLTAVDWQVSGRGNALYDVVYFLGGSLSTALRREIAVGLLRHYYDTMAAGGVAMPDYAAFQTDYRRMTLAGLLVAVFVCGGFDLANERGLKLLTVGLKRWVALLEDADPAEFLD